MYGYTKLFQTIVTSTIWQEPNDCRVLWITMLALRDKDNVCRATVPALAKLSSISVEDAEKYLFQFQQPDRYSRSQEHEGRRIEKVEDGWFILNGAKYAQMLRHEERKDYVAGKVREYRHKINSVNTRKHSKPKKPISDTDTDTDTDNTPYSPPRGDERFELFWKEYPRKVGKKVAVRAFNKLSLSDDLFAEIMKALARQRRSPKWEQDSGAYIPNPSTWINQERWNDEVELSTGDRILEWAREEDRKAGRT